MEAIWSAEIRGMFSYYRIAVVLLADIGLDMNLSLTCLAWLDDIFPQVWKPSSLIVACWSLSL